MTRTLWLVLGMLVTLHLGCNAAETPGASDGSGGSSAGGDGAESGSGGVGGAGGPGGVGGSAGVGGEPVNHLGRARCRPPEGMNGTPHSIEDAVALLNALPKPTSVACFVESLDRPLIANATSSTFSAQPATSYESPRVFVKVDRTWISVVIDGDATDLIEFGYLLDDGLHSIKGELKLPSTEAIAPTAPFDRVRFGESSTVCGLCHRDETLERVVGDTSIYSSLSFRPRPETVVPLDFLRNEAQTCDWALQPHRCEMLSAIFDGGPVDDGQFPAEMVTFF